MSNYSQTLIVTLTLVAGACAAEDGPSTAPGSAESRQQSVQTADAANRLLALSNAAVGVGQVGQRQAFVFDLQAEIEAGAVDMVGWGRMAFANPEFGRQIFLDGRINQKKSCIACSKCTELMRKKTVTGCVIRDSEIYKPYLSGEKQPDWD